jgi:hypothetical protein
MNIAFDRRTAHDRAMSEEEIGEMQDALREYKKQFDALKEDLKIVVQNCPSLRTEIIVMSGQSGNPRSDQENVNRCKAFAVKYGIRVG